MKYKILITGLPGSGKTTLAKALVRELKNLGSTEWINADRVRQACNDWDFSIEGRNRQSNRLRVLADASAAEYVVCDFVAPTDEIRQEFNADYTIWMNTINKGRYEDTNELYTIPTKYDYSISTYNDNHLSVILSNILDKTK